MTPAALIYAHMIKQILRSFPSDGPPQKNPGGAYLRANLDVRAKMQAAKAARIAANGAEPVHEHAAPVTRPVTRFERPAAAPKRGRPSTNSKNKELSVANPAE